MIRRNGRIYKIGERSIPRDKNVLLYMADGSVNIADAEMVEICPAGITHWCEVPEIESAFEREATERAAPLMNMLTEMIGATFVDVTMRCAACSKPEQHKDGLCRDCWQQYEEDCGAARCGNSL